MAVPHPDPGHCALKKLTTDQIAMTDTDAYLQIFQARRVRSEVLNSLNQQADMTAAAGKTGTV